MAGHLMTREDYEKRKAHLEYLKSTRTLEIAEMLKIARGFGDLSENAEYDAAKDEQSKNEHDIALLEEELRTAQIIERSAMSGDKVGNSDDLISQLYLNVAKHVTLFDGRLYKGVGVRYDLHA